MDPKNRTATLRYLYEQENPLDVLTTLRTLHESVKTIPIPAKEISGVQCPGFRIDERQSTLLVWVDPKTRLPAYAERTYSPALLERDRDVQQVIETFDDMKFDEPIADELFAVTPPAGYTVTTVGTPPADRKVLFAEPLVVTPNVGIGPLKFGTSRAEIIRLLGKPDSEDIHVPNFPVKENTVQVGDQPRPPGASLIVLTENHFMKYNGLGLELTVEIEEGLRGIRCLGQDSLGSEGRTFHGATNMGIRIGSAAEDVLKAYGKADENQAGDILGYRELHLEFIMTEKQTVRSINLSDSYEHRLRLRMESAGRVRDRLGPTSAR